MGLRYLLDEHISRRVAEEISKRGVDARAVDGDPELAGQEDRTILRAAVREGRVLVTYNNGDYALLLGDLIRDGKDVPGVVFVDEATIPNRDVGGLVRALVKLAQKAARREADVSGGLFLQR